MITRSIMLNIRHRLLLTKMGFYRLESGKNNITKQVGNMGLKSFVVGKNGRGYEKHEWSESNTFWISDQSNLLIANNQTRKFDQKDPDERSRLERFAWGQATEAGRGNIPHAT